VNAASRLSASDGRLVIASSPKERRELIDAAQQLQPGLLVIERRTLFEMLALQLDRPIAIERKRVIAAIRRNYWDP
jgi:hypothetical protein